MSCLAIPDTGKRVSKNITFEIIYMTESINGYLGDDTCQHEWFVSTNSNTDTVNANGLLWTKTQIVSRQCTKCGKQTTTLNIWKTYEKDTTGGN